MLEIIKKHFYTVMIIIGIIATAMAVIGSNISNKEFTQRLHNTCGSYQVLDHTRTYVVCDSEKGAVVKEIEDKQ